MYKDLNHVMHSAVLGVVLYFVMIYGMGQSQSMAMSRSILIAALALVYMVMYGHSMPPGNLNSSLGF
jgi:hypothetical protein